VVDRLRSIGSDLTGRGAIESVAAGVVTGGMSVAIAVSFSALVFTGPLAAHLPVGLGLALFGSAVMALVVSLTSGFSAAVAGIQDNPTAILAVAATAIAAKAAPDQLLPTTIAVIVVATVATGIALYLVGRLRLGSIIRYMPYPVIGGFLAATGLLIARGGIDILREAADVGGVASIDSLLLLVPGLVIGLAMFGLDRWSDSGMKIPILLGGSVLAMRLGMLLSGVHTDEAIRRGWLFGPFPDAAGWSPDTLRMLTDADWANVGEQWLTLASLVLISVVSLLLNVGAIEHASGVGVDIDREMRINGVAGVLAGAGGGMPGYQYLSLSAVLYRVGNGRRAAALVAAVVVAATFVVGPALLTLIPTAVIGGILLALGGSYIVEWLWDARARMSRIDHGLVLAISATVLLAGFLAAIVLGIIIAVGLFAVRYSRVDVVHRTYSIGSTSSTLDRPPPHRTVLAASGSEGLIVEVRGFIFFGTATRLFERVLAIESAQAVSYLVLDLSQMTGADSSFMAAFQRFDRATRGDSLTIVAAGTPPRLWPIIDRGLAAGRHPYVRAESLDSAIQWCEDQILRGAGIDASAEISVEFAEYVKEIVGVAESGPVLAHATGREIPAGTPLIEAGSDAPGLFFLEEGLLEAVVRSDGRDLRLRQMLPGAVIGEISLYRGGAATATVLAVTDCRVRHISIEDLVRLEQAEPATAAAIHRFAAAVLADRLLHAERIIRT
jgi:SulP family sulfate permease